MKPCPLIFEPIFKPKIWGGRRLEALLSKSLPEGALIGESWEIADLEDDASRVVRGPAKGKTLADLLRDWGADLMGRVELFEGRFPLLIKFLDASQSLSVQVHPDEAMAKRLGGNVRVKHEAWYIVDATKDGCIYRGVRDGVDKAALSDAIAGGTVASLLNRIPVRKGHCYYLPSGTLHALGAGVVVAEVQTTSDITYRVYDWDRVDPATGTPRELHIERALECVSFDDAAIVVGEQRSHVASVWTAVTRLVTCASFIIERVRMVEGVEQEFCYQEPVVWIVLEGRGQIPHAGMDEPTTFERGDTVLLPAALEGGRVKTEDDCMWLEVTVPVPSSLPNLNQTQRAALKSADGGGGGRFVPVNLPGSGPTGA